MPGEAGEERGGDEPIQGGGLGVLVYHLGRPEGHALPVDNMIDRQHDYVAVSLAADAPYRDRAEQAQAIMSTGRIAIPA
jgi:hypothetical protein